MEFIDKKINEELNIGIEESAFEMASIGQFMQKVGDAQNKTGFKVFVTNDSRPLSHIHIVQKDGIKKKVCVEFSNPPKYFKHDGYEDSFSKEESEEFNNFLSMPYKYAQVFSMGSIKFNVKTYWDYCIYQWKLENDGSVDNLHLEVDKEGFVIFPQQPDYSILG